MLDSRVETFLIVARTLNYTKAAEELFITQPAVTQHIQYLEREYAVKFFSYSNRQIRLTEAGQLFLKYAQESKAADKIMGRRLKAIEDGENQINFSATLTIGEFTIAPIMKEFFNKFQKSRINIGIHNTEYILASLKKGEIEFALIEGLFDKNNFTAKLLKEEEFVLVVNPEHSLASKKKVMLEDIFNEKIIIREHGSGSRDILERGLYDKNHSIEEFYAFIEIGNVALMKRAVKDNIGISFMYQDAAKIEIEQGDLKQVEIQDFKLFREFNFVTVDKRYIVDQTDKYYHFFKEHINSSI